MFLIKMADEETQNQENKEEPEFEPRGRPNEE